MRRYGSGRATQRADDRDLFSRCGNDTIEASNHRSKTMSLARNECRRRTGLTIFDPEGILR
ncbi:hypothetical protein BN2475_1270003 [Paraburkholderia ribeironis]|uniref:Uncharacterized protein n=1 Tax=Paraburkholderia ribeironis TaxID=1247936 RepID=A0A1N7SP39_9BURK|nr:hypothetical protein BN2475_1270003 [Paraburkholderia ribeironis]